MDLDVGRAETRDVGVAAAGGGAGARRAVLAAALWDALLQRLSNGTGPDAARVNRGVLLDLAAFVEAAVRAAGEEARAAEVRPRLAGPLARGDWAAARETLAEYVELR